MKKVKIDISDLMIVLEAMMETGTTEIVFFEHGDSPAIADANDLDNIITFSSVSAEGVVNDEDETIH